MTGYRMNKQLELRIQCQMLLKTERILIIKPTAALISQIYFWNKTLHVSDSSSVHHREFNTVHTALVYIIQVC